MLPKILLNFLLVLTPILTTNVFADSESINDLNFDESHFPHLPSPIPVAKQFPTTRRNYEEDPRCHPNVTSNQPQYLIGYGSLMQKESKDRTDPKTGESLPVRVFGYSRLWNCKGESASLGTTYLGVKPTRSRRTYFNAVVFKLNSPNSLSEYDARESYYCREEVPMSKIQLLSGGTTSFNRGQQLTVGQYWIYVTKPKYAKLPSRKYPIVQSYVDTFLSGCFEIEEKYKLDGFAEECVQTTKEFHSPWVNDRIYPRRPFLHQPYAGKIDKLLNEKVPRAFKTIIVE